VKKGSIQPHQQYQCITVEQGQGAIIADADQMCAQDFEGMLITIDNIRNPELLKWCGQSVGDLFENSFLFAPSQRIKRIYADLMDIPCSNKEAYVKLKGLEALLYLENEKKNVLTKNLSGYQMQAAILARQKICDDCLIKVCDLCDALHVSTSYMQKAFKTMYGISMATFTRQRKMEQAAHYLMHTND
jgi:AraC-like DNA-binding protein